jgi:hypothetical protein
MQHGRLGAALTAGLAGTALALACLLGAVLRFGSGPAAERQPVTLGAPAATPAPSRDNPDMKEPREHRPPVRLWRNPGPSSNHPPRARKALA